MTKFPRTPPTLGLIFPAYPLYFVTCCTYRRRSYLANDRAHTALIEFGQTAEKKFAIAIGRYILMPDHLHLFVRGSDDFVLSKWIGTLKRVLAKQLDASSHDPFWQRGFFDHLLRSSESYSEKWNYVRENPVRAGLVKSADEWPYAGEIVPIYFD